MYMPYEIKERMHRAYQDMIDFHKAMRKRISNSTELLIFGKGGDAAGDAVYIRGHSVAVDWFIDYIEELGQGAVRVTPQNFHELNPQSQPVQLSLDNLMEN